MQQSRLAVRYAKSLLDLATEQKSVDALFADMQCVFNTCKNNKNPKESSKKNWKFILLMKKVRMEENQG